MWINRIRDIGVLKIRVCSCKVFAPVTVWSEVTSEKIIWPHFFENPDEYAVTVTGEGYREMLVNFVQPEIENMAGYCWEYLKAKVYVNKPRTNQQLKANISEEICSI